MAVLSTRLRMRLGRVRQEYIARAMAKLPRSSLRLLPSSSRIFGPPRRSATFREYLARHAGEWIPVLAAARSSYPAPKALPDDAKLLCRPFGALTWPEAGVAAIPDGRVLDDNAWPVGERDTFLHEFAYKGSEPSCPIYLIRKLAAPIRLAGTALNLGSCWAPINFGHFVLDALPRLELFHRAGLSLDRVNHVIVPRFAGPSAAKLIERLGIPPHKLLRPERGTQYQFDLLLQPSYPGRSAFYRPLVAEFYRRPEFAIAEPCRQRRRLYIPRYHVRRIVNETDVAAVLAARGFETVDFRTLVDEPSYFAEAEAIVGAHGAGLSSLVFCRPGTRILELAPSNHLYPFFYSAACAAQLDYWCVIGRAEIRGGASRHAPPTDANFFVDIHRLETLLDRMNLTPRDPAASGSIGARVG